MIPITQITGRLGNQMFQFAALYAMTRDMGVDYYVQDDKYFSKYKNDILYLFGSNISRIDRVSLHVRRTDYVDNTFYVDVWKNGYYDRAIEEFPDQKFLVFSDDINWCKENIKGDRFEFSEGKDQIEDLNLMASCTGHIIANSSYSWWGAYLSPHGGKVTYPKDWFTDGINRTVCPNNWIAK